MEIEELKRRFAEALKKRNWCPCCGYCGMWPPSNDKEWDEFLTEVFSRDIPVKT
jgi:hypothetical protein